jgi:hypothetical protein
MNCASAVGKKPKINTKSSFNRRSFLQYSGASLLGGVILSACGGSGDDPAPVVIIDPVVVPPDPFANADKTLAFIGDSLTLGSGGTAYGYMVEKLFPGRPVVINAIGGQSAVQIATRQGSLPITVTVEGDAFNGANAIKVSKINTPFLSTEATMTKMERKGTIAGVKSTITRIGTAAPNRTETYTITPDAASSVAIPADSVFVLEDAVKLKTATQAFWYGRNNVSKPENVASISSCLESSINFLSDPKRFLVLGVLTSSDEVKGTELYERIIAVNEQLAAKYTTHYVTMAPPTEAEMVNAKYVPTAKDKEEIGKGTFPSGMKFDNFHLNTIGYQIVADRVSAKLKELKY